MARLDGHTGRMRASGEQYSRHGQLPRCTWERASSASSSPTGSVRPVSRLRNSTSTVAQRPVVEVVVRHEPEVLFSAGQSILDAVDGRMDGAGKPLEPAEGRQRHAASSPSGRRGQWNR